MPKLSLSILFALLSLITLYDIVADPGQHKDLAAEQPEKANAMQKALAEWQGSVKDRFACKDCLSSIP